MRDILIAIALGIVLGWLDIFAYKTRQWFSRISTGCLLLMLACLGAKIGCDRELLHNLALMGGQSLVLALAVMGGSALMVHVLGKLFARETAALSGQDQEQKHRGPGPDYTMTHKVGAALVLGVAAGYLFLSLESKSWLDTTLLSALTVMVFLAGIDIGANRHLLAKICTPRNIVLVLALPVGIAVGTMLAGWLIGPLVGLSRYDALLAASCMGWYSLGSVVVSTMYNTTAGTITFLTNMLRETLAILLMPFFVRWDRLTAMSLAGAATMDSNLPIVISNTNLQIGMVGFVSGLTLTLLVPPLLTYLLP
jgi:uncharacterized membrane protein YbjE (DUF340 family)